MNCLRQRRRLGRFGPMYVMLIPGLVILLVNDYLPMFGVSIAFLDIRYSHGLIRGILDGTWIGFKNFEFLMATKDAFVVTRNTILYNLAFIVLDLVFSAGLAIALNEMTNQKTSRVYHSFLLLPHFFSFVVASYIVYAFLHVDYGYLNSVILPRMGAEPVHWYSTPAYWPVILSIVHIWKYVGYNSIVYLAALSSLDTGLFEAARIDGASKWQQISRITIPLLVPLMVVLTLLEVGKIFYADFGLFYQIPLDSGPLYRATNVLDTYVYRALLHMGDIGMASAAGLYQAVVGFILVVAANAAVKRINPDYALF